MDKPNVIEINDLKKHYIRGSETIKALDGIDMAVKPGELVAVVGPSGSGKTTLMNIISCLDTPDNGSVKVAGRETAGLNESGLIDIRRREIGYVFQRFYLIPTLSVQENVALPLMFLNGKPRKRKKDEPEWSAFEILFSSVDSDPLASALRETGLINKGKQKIRNLTGGDKQRVAIARALVKRPSVILADEPTGRLEPEVRDEIFALFRQLAENGVTFVIATHDLEAAALCDRTIYLQDGKVVNKEESWLFA
ncbi:MAG: ABC transporter ATP-binding protein [bacterium]|nr:ABC transporter ATP-binding protein [bacterium]